MHGMQQNSCSLTTLDAHNKEFTIQNRNRKKSKKKQDKKDARHSKKELQKLQKLNKRQRSSTLCQLNAAVFSLGIPVEENDLSDFGFNHQCKQLSNIKKSTPTKKNKKKLCNSLMKHCQQHVCSR
jgi:hypothetical protein